MFVMSFRSRCTGFNGGGGVFCVVRSELFLWWYLYGLVEILLAKLELNCTSIMM